MAQGLTNDEVAAKLYMSPLTAETHVSRMMSKLGPVTGPACRYRV